MNRRRFAGLCSVFVLTFIVMGLLDCSAGMASPLLYLVGQYTTGNWPVSVAIGDLDGDNAPDLAFAITQDSEVSVLLGNGDGTFQAAANYLVGSWPRAIAAADLDGDTYPDLATGNESTRDISVYLNDGDGTFPLEVRCGVGTEVQGIALGDLSGDDLPDLVVGGMWTQIASVLINSGCPYDLDDDGHTAAHCGGDDCNDLNANIFPGNPNTYCDCEAPFPQGTDEICDDGVDDDGDGLIDSADPDCPCLDSDGDGSGQPAGASCTHPGLDCLDDPGGDPPVCGGCTCGNEDCAPCARCIHPDAEEFMADAVDSNCAPEGCPGGPVTSGSDCDDCFIATAAFGRAMPGKIDVLKSFRDRYLVPHGLGRAFLTAYYTHSPPVAAFIARRPWLRGLVRTLLLPLVGLVSLLP